MNPLDARRRLLGRNVYKKTAEGNPAIAQGSLARRYPGITMQGWTEQAQYEGSQLFDKSTVVSNTYISDVSGVALPDSAGERSASDYINVEGMSSVFATKMVGPGSWMAFYDNEKNFVSGNEGLGYGVPIAVPDNATYARFTVRNESIESFMVNEGNVLLPWEPYTGGQPSPSPEYPQEIKNAGKYDEASRKYEYEVKLTGKNLWNAEEAADKSNWVRSTSQKGYSDFAIEVKPGEKVTFSFPEKLPLGIITYVAIVSVEDGSAVKWLYHSTSESLIVQQATVTAITDKIWVRCNTSSIEEFVQDNPYFQVEYGEERTDFQPYKEQTVTLTADRPLTKWDKLEKRNGQWGWVYKSAEIESYTDESVPGEYFSTTGQLSTGAQVWYETTTETFVPLSESEQEAMNALYTFRPTTVLSNDAGCNMTLTYKTKKSLEVTT